MVEVVVEVVEVVVVDPSVVVVTSCLTNGSLLIEVEASVEMVVTSF